MECADGEQVEVDVTNDAWDDNWDGCFNRNSQIFRCPFPYIPCEDMWPGKKDFYCGKNNAECKTKGGKRQTCNGGMNSLNSINTQLLLTNVCLDLKCIYEPRTSGEEKQPRCANGQTYSAGWSKCRDNGSGRIQCPKNTYPCNGLVTGGSAEYPEFACNRDCKNSVRAHQCQGRSTTLNTNTIRILLSE